MPFDFIHVFLSKLSKLIKMNHGNHRAVLAAFVSSPQLILGQWEKTWLGGREA